MTKHQLGRSELSVPPLIFGGNVFGWTADEAMSFRLLDALMDAGFNAIDTADVYSAWVPGHQGGESETIIGRWLKRTGGRDKVTIATKVGKRMGSGDEGLSRAWIVREVEASLTRLQTDYIDLYYSHADDPSVPLEETLQTFADLVRQGKVRVLGASNYGAARLKLALDTSVRLGLPRYECLQPGYNLMDRTGFEAELAPLCRAEGLGVAPYYALAAGFLSGKYRSTADLADRARGAKVKEYLTDRGLRVLAALEAAAKRHKASMSQIALAWLLAKPAVTAPIVSATDLGQLAELLKAPAIVLDSETVAELDRASA
ncbi:aldo/keto reductase [Telmatospirillum siberiense]|uniref:Alcohol dehydrogenase n=1 Tax=Telmatospirillum siberiense TaxID=382514 RepID=A0A2N3PVI8_9PROT|nr:aldo/keto reductase [Telmatospirillum siberiense]PKU24423.1 alcohol dehydrogenase [Telmatospirillum siberiense]